MTYFVGVCRSNSSHGKWQSDCRCWCRSNTSCVCLESSGNEPEAAVYIQLVPLDSKHIIRCDIDPDATIEQVSARFKQAAMNNVKWNIRSE